MIRFALAAVVTWLVNLLRTWLAWLIGVRVNTFTPHDGWPGTIVTILGNGFSTNRDANLVTIGGADAIIIEAEANRLLVLAGETTVTGPVVVSVGGNTATTASTFTVAPYPPVTDLGASGPPVFFHGPQHGTPKINVPHQKVQVIFGFPTDHNPGSPASRALLRNAAITRINDAARYWDEASYGSTTWDMTYSDWVAFPHNRRFYFWEQGDIDDARRALLRATARSVAVGGPYVAHAVDGGWINAHHPNTGTLTALSGVINPDGSQVMALRRIGNTLYAGTDAGGFFIYDLTNESLPALRGSVTFPGRSVWGIDLAGTTAVVALVDSGVGLVNVTTATAPAVTSLGTASADWCVAVKAVGNRVYATRGTRLHVYDLAAGALVPVADLNAGGFGTGVDVVGTVCIVTTDGNGARIFETNAGGALERSTSLSVTRPRSVRISGAQAFLAANDGGLVVIGLANLGAPTLTGTLSLAKPAYGIEITGAEAIVAGARDVMAIDVFNPATPTITATEAGATSEPDLATLRTNLAQADDAQAIVKNGNRLFIDLLSAWFTATGKTVNDLNGFEGVIIVINGGFLRGQSWTTGSFSDVGSTITFNSTKGVIYFAIDANWGRIAHEIGHWLGMWDIYEEWYADGTIFVGSAQNWCLSGNSDIGPLFCGHHMYKLMKFYKFEPPLHPGINLAQRTWSPTSVLNETFDIVAHGVTEDTAFDRVHVVKLTAATGLQYYLEVRQTPAGRIFDQTPDLPAGDIGRVVVLRVTEGSSISNTFERPIQLVDRLAVGGTFVDAARNLVVTVESKIQDTPLVYRVRVQWNQPVAGNPNGTFDLTITPWTTDNYETVDIWVDSPRNNPGALPTYEFHEPGAPDKPILNGDRPWVRRKNTIFARIRNTGPSAVPNAWVSCYVNSPPGIGDDGNWALLETKSIGLTGFDATVPGSGQTVVGFDWKPNVGQHTCIKIAVLPQIGEIEPNNNSAQENVFTFDSAAASSHQPVLLDAMVRSPFTVWRKVDLRVRGLPDGWHAVVDHAWVWVPGKGSYAVKAVIWTDLGTSAQGERKVPPLAMARVEGWTNFDHRYLPIGGLLANVKAVKRRSIEVKVEGGRTMSVWGHVDPPLDKIPVTIEVVDPGGKSILGFATTNPSGDFRTSMPQGQGQLTPQTYTVQAFITAGADAAEAESNILVVTVH